MSGAFCGLLLLYALGYAVYFLVQARTYGDRDAAVLGIRSGNVGQLREALVGRFPYAPVDVNLVRRKPQRDIFDDLSGETLLHQALRYCCIDCI